MKYILVLTLGLFTSMAFADHHGKDHPAMSKEEREKMAASHEAMAACLRSDKDMKECHKEMHASCEAMGDKCPMEGHHHPNKAMHGKKMGEKKTTK